MHADIAKINLEEVLQADAMKVLPSLRRLMWLCFWVGIITFSVAMFSYPPELFWAAYFTSTVFFMGLSAGSVMIAVILQIVRAVWAAPIRRFAEAGASYFPWALLSFLMTYFGRHHLFPWANHPMPGKEWWMQPNFVFARHTICLGLMFYLLWLFVKMSLRSDVGLLRERFSHKDRWAGWLYQGLSRNWRGSSVETVDLQRKMSVFAPVLVFVYAVVYSLFAFEFVMGMDPMWISNLFGGFYFIGNIYIAWATILILAYFYQRTNSDYAKVIAPGTRWDLGKLTFGFCMLWGYFFFSQFLPQWYGNLPEETQWMILRTREYPWKSLGWIIFSMCFIIPFTLLLSRDLKKTGAAAATVGFVILIGVWLEKYIAIMPNVSPDVIPFGYVELGLFFGFLGMYVLSITNFLSKFPFVPVSHPQTQGRDDW